MKWLRRRKKNEKQLLTILAKKGKEARDLAMKSHIINKENEIIISDHDYVKSNAEEITADVDLHCLIEEPDSVTTHTPNVKRNILTPTRKRKCNPAMKKNALDYLEKKREWEIAVRKKELALKERQLDLEEKNTY
ncbi:uncharacterized protein isoform X3 [Leptinotarsa decemlineata]|uniref:uncharacterized protein isoform X3 n=1 Tax=Leptinotarsa decemlineata TaxID=7539 RepID=UPI003D309AEF